VAPPGADSEDWKGVLRHGPSGTRQIALTIDDGYCIDCVARYVDFAQRTGIHLTFSPNGIYDSAWAPQAAVLRPLIEAGQVQIINHTFSHPRLTRLRTSRIKRELDRNEQWIIKTFATIARPYYRPPFGVHNDTVDSVAADLGFDRVVLWNGSFSDSTVITPEFLMSQARKYLQPGVIMLGHANHPTVLGLFDEITRLISDRRLEPVTLHEMFGTIAEQLPPGLRPSETAIPI
jgi:peptidoglycan/xylan/chitin deacetylase (PgdA/CDA1 family)